MVGWSTAAMGLTSCSHDGFRSVTTTKVVDPPIIKFWPADWKTPGEELYQNIKFWPSATALVTGYSVQSKKDHVATWINQYGKGKVFATTLGHNMLTVGPPSSTPLSLRPSPFALRPSPLPLPPQQLIHGRPDIGPGHQRFAHQHGIDAGRFQSFDVLPGADAAFADHAPVAGHLPTQP